MLTPAGFELVFYLLLLAAGLTGAHALCVGVFVRLKRGRVKKTAR